MGTKFVPILCTLNVVTTLTLCPLQAFRDYKQELLLHKVDMDDNTISHVAAANGNTKLFKVHGHATACTILCVILME